MPAVALHAIRRCASPCHTCDPRPCPAVPCLPIPASDATRWHASHSGPAIAASPPAPADPHPFMPSLPRQQCPSCRAHEALPAMPQQSGPCSANHASPATPHHPRPGHQRSGLPCLPHLAFGSKPSVPALPSLARDRRDKPCLPRRTVPFTSPITPSPPRQNSHACPRLALPAMSRNARTGLAVPPEAMPASPWADLPCEG